MLSFVFKKQFRMKSIPCLLLLSFLTINSFAQKREIVKLLNEALQEELTIQDSTHSYGYLIKEVIQPHHIINDSLKVKLRLKYNDKPKETVITQQVALKDITSFGKDINVFFGSDKETVLNTREDYAKNGKDIIIATYNGTIYFAFVYTSQNNQALGQKLKRATEKAGYKLRFPYWAN